MDRIRTADLYYGAYLLSCGGKLEGVESVDGHKFTFEISCSDARRLASQYLSGEAVVNVRYLRSSLKHLKDVIFEKLTHV